LLQSKYEKDRFSLGLSILFACHGNESADNKPTDLDGTKNNDTSAVIKDV